MPDKTLPMFSECPNCSSIWGVGSEEWEWQECDCCGWPNNMDDYDDTDDVDEFDIIPDEDETDLQ